MDESARDSSSFSSVRLNSQDRLTSLLTSSIDSRAFSEPSAIIDDDNSNENTSLLLFTKNNHNSYHTNSSTNSSARMSRKEMEIHAGSSEMSMAGEKRKENSAADDDDEDDEADGGGPVARIAMITHVRDGGDESNPKFKFPGWDEPQLLEFEDLPRVRVPKRKQLYGLLETTAISGNDVASSMLYSIGSVAVAAQQLSPLCFIMSGLVVAIFRGVYTEACTAFPLNGGVYNVLLNTTSKAIASFAACLMLLSYVSTAVVSATESVNYMGDVVDVSVLTLSFMTLFLLILIAGIYLSGVRVIGTLAIIILGFHLCTVGLLCVWGIGQAMVHPQVLVDNMSLPLPSTSDVLWSLVWGFSEAMLGVTGVETLGNYVEEQQTGIFYEAARNMSLFSLIINPLMAIGCLCVLPMDIILARPNDVISAIAFKLGGNILGILVTIDAALVLIASSLAAFVGVCGLLYRLALDRVISPRLLDKDNKGSRSILLVGGFCIVCMATFILFGHDTRRAGKIYTLAMLSVMVLYALGAGMIKYKRPFVRRQTTAKWKTIIATVCFCSLAIFINVWTDINNFSIFCIYIGCAAIFVFSLFERSRFAKISYLSMQKLPSWLSPIAPIARFENHSPPSLRRVVVFCKTPNLDMMNRAMQYSHHNEPATRVIVAHCFLSTADPSLQELANNLSTLSRLYPKIRMDLCLVNGLFCCETVHSLSQRLKIPTNFMFISAPESPWQHSIADYGGLRIITH